jgi:hypothetical protein
LIGGGLLLGSTEILTPGAAFSEKIAAVSKTSGLPASAIS